MCSPRRRRSVLLHGHDVLTVEEDLARDDLAGVWYQTHDREGSDRLAASGFADKTEDFASVDRQRHFVHCLDDTVASIEVCLEAFDLQKEIARLTGSRRQWCDLLSGWGV